MTEMPKPVRWAGSSREDLREFPEEVRRAVGIALRLAQHRRIAPYAKPFKVGKGGGAGVMEIVENAEHG